MISNLFKTKLTALSEYLQDKQRNDKDEYSEEVYRYIRDKKWEKLYHKRRVAELVLKGKTQEETQKKETGLFDHIPEILESNAMMESQEILNEDKLGGVDGHTKYR